MNIKLSIVVPCYQAGRYLQRCLDSLLSQSLEEMEIICVNDGSTDSTLPLLQSYAEQYGRRVVIIDKEKNEGIWKARWDGILAASGKYTGFADPDDYVLEGYAKTMYEAAVRWDADIACCGFDRIDMETGKRFSREMTRFAYRSFNIQRDPGLLPEVNTALWNKIYRTDMLRRVPAPAHVPARLEDLAFSLLIYIHAGTIIFVRKSLIRYMVRSGSEINSIERAHISSIYKALREIRHCYLCACGENKPGMLAYMDAAAFVHLGISLMCRLSQDPDFNRILRRNTAFLDRAFPGWRKNPYITLSFTLRHRGANLKILIVRWLYRLRLFGCFLTVYRFMIDHLKIDIKW